MDTPPLPPRSRLAAAERYMPPMVAAAVAQFADLKRKCELRYGKRTSVKYVTGNGRYVGQRPGTR
eukprot:4542280-Prymnesium_polylepis.1